MIFAVPRLQGRLAEVQVERNRCLLSDVSVKKL